MDGVRYTPAQAGHQDSLLQPSVINLVSWKRHLLGFVRKGDMCDCGCGGKHTVRTLMSVAVWQLETLASGQWPLQKHDQGEWSDTEEWASQA
eukprot:1428613-Pyramimonas_sp.AAC.1